MDVSVEYSMPSPVEVDGNGHMDFWYREGLVPVLRRVKGYSCHTVMKCKQQVSIGGVAAGFLIRLGTETQGLWLTVVSQEKDKVRDKNFNGPICFNNYLNKLSIMF